MGLGALACVLACLALWAALRGAPVDHAAGPHAAPRPLQTHVLRHDIDHLAVRDQVERWVDESATADLADAMHAQAAGRFQPYPGMRSAGFTSAAHWFRFQIRLEPGHAAHPDAPDRWLLAPGAPYLNDVQVWVLQPDGQLQHRQLGDRFPDQPGVHGVRGNMIHLPVTQAPVTVWMRVRTSSAMNVNIDLWRPVAYFSDEMSATFRLGIFVCSLAVIVVIYGLLGLWLRDPVSLAYAGYMVTQLLLYLGSTGTAQLLFPGGPVWRNDLIVGIGAMGALTAALPLWIHVFEMPKRFPRMAKVYGFTALALLLLLPLTATDHHGMLASSVFLLSIPAIAFNCWMAARLWLERRTALESTYLLAFSVLQLGVFLIVALLFGLLPRTPLTEIGQPLCTITHSLLMCVALGMRVARSRTDRFQAEREAHMQAERRQEHQRFVAVMTHEFRNPLAGIDRAANLMEAMHDMPREDVMRRLAGIRSQVRHLDTLVDSVVLTESSDEHALRPQRQDTSVAEFLTQLHQSLSPEMQQRVRITRPPGALDFPLDARLTALALRNLLDNALRYSPMDATVDLGAHLSAPPGATLTLTVADRGPGLSPAEIALLGTPYHRATGAVGKQGTGLGYHFSRRIVEAQGGQIEASPRDGGGLVVDVHLPLAGS